MSKLKWTAVKGTGIRYVDVKPEPLKKPMKKPKRKFTAVMHRDTKNLIHHFALETELFTACTNGPGKKLDYELRRNGSILKEFARAIQVLRKAGFSVRTVHIKQAARSVPFRWRERGKL